MFGALSSTPSFAAGIPIFAVGATTRRSHATASCMPAPSAAPFTAAMTGAGKSTIASSTRSNAGRNVSPPPCSSPPVSCARRMMSAPGAERDACTGDHDGPQALRLLEVAAQLVAELGVERVATLGAVDRRQPDVLLR